MRNPTTKLGKIAVIIFALSLFGLGMLQKASIGEDRWLFSKANIIEASIVTLVGIIVAIVVTSLRSKKANENKDT